MSGVAVGWSETFAGGWTDQRLVRAYFEIEDALQTHNNPDDDAHQLLKDALKAIEDADCELERRS